MIEAGPRLVGPEEPEAGSMLAGVFASEGITVMTGVTVESVHHDDGHFVLAVSGSETIVSRQLLVATGRRVDLAVLNVASVGLDGSAPLRVDDHLRVEGVDRLWAVGDITDHGAFTHVSMYQADIVVNDILGGEVVPADYRAVPRVTFTDPEIGSVGVTELEARAEGLRVRVGLAPVPESTRGWIHAAGNEGFVKLVQDEDRGVLVGATSAGPWGGEVLGLLTLAIHAEVPVGSLRSMIYAYPTFHRVVEAALRDLLAAPGRAIGLVGGEAYAVDHAGRSRPSVQPETATAASRTKAMTRTRVLEGWTTRRAPSSAPTNMARTLTRRRPDLEPGPPTSRASAKMAVVVNVSTVVVRSGTATFRTVAFCSPMEPASRKISEVVTGTRAG